MFRAQKVTRQRDQIRRYRPIRFCEQPLSRIAHFYRTQSILERN